MKNTIIYSIILTCFSFSIRAQVLNVGKNEQEHDQWCWSACSKTILDYYGFPKSQCQIADWTRTTATFYNFGSTPCCTDATKGCNYWNYNSGSAGSIQEILVHFGKLQNTSVSALTQAQVKSELGLNHLFVIRWGWDAGGGHFIVGHGLNVNNLYYMNPWFGEGLKIGTYSWVSKGDTHTWTHTNKITSVTTGLPELVSDLKSSEAIPNPFSTSTQIDYY